MFTHMIPMKTCEYTARDQGYDILVFRVAETGEHRIYISKGSSFGAEKLFVAVAGDVISDANNMAGPDLVEEMIKSAIVVREAPSSTVRQCSDIFYCP